MGPGDTIRDRYSIVTHLGSGAGGESFLARDTQSGVEVVLKTITLGRLGGWRELDSLEREAKVLSGLSHPRVPRYIDSFRLDLPEGPVFFLVRRYIPGRSLDQLVRQGWRGTEQEITDIAVALLELVAYIHGLRPPVIHRDINPGNVIQDDDGAIHLVDFGGVLEPTRPDRSVTVTGTAGYTPLEQWSGEATPRSDLYAAASTIVFLLTHRNPADLPRAGLRVDYRAATTVSTPMGHVLDALLEPDEALRAMEPEDAIHILRTGEVPAVSLPSPPWGSRIRRHTESGEVVITVPERGAASVSVPILGFSAFWLFIVAVWTGMTISLGAPTVMTLFSLPFWLVGLGLLRRGLRSVLGRATLRVGPDGLTCRRRLVFSGRATRVPLGAVSEVSTTAGGPVRIQAGARALTLGQSLSLPEKTWLRDTLTREIERRRG